VTWTEATIRILTISALAGLLGAVGLRLTWKEVKSAVTLCPFARILLINFVVVPALTLTAVRCFGFQREIGVAMILLAASPFAPVVPVFARMARADLALAAGLTAVFPVASALLTPLAAQVALRSFTEAGVLRFELLSSLVLLVTTTSLPLAGGVIARHFAPELSLRLLRPLEIISEATGAASLAFVTVTEFRSIVNLGWSAWLTMALVFEMSLLLGWAMGGKVRGSRQVVALGTGNRNIALALLVAIQNFHGTSVVSGVVGNGLVLIGLGLVHVGWWRFFKGESHSS
jgi:BASS family bile acid:Na+ symporter